MKLIVAIVRPEQLSEVLEALFGRHVDVMTPRSIRNPFFRRSVDASRQVIYEQERAEAIA